MTLKNQGVSLASTHVCKSVAGPFKHAQVLSASIKTKLKSESVIETGKHVQEQSTMNRK